jgi:maleate isomerase
MPDSCQIELERLLAATGCSRTTLRMLGDDGLYPVVGEARAEGIRTLVGSPIDIRSAATFRALDRGRELLVQDDLSRADPPPPAQLIEVYGVRAQMLAPLERDGELVGVISVHETKGPRAWTDADRAQLIAAAEAIARQPGVHAGGARRRDAGQKVG